MATRVAFAALALLLLSAVAIIGSPSPHPGDAGVPAFASFSLVVIGGDGGQLSFVGRSEFVNVGIGFTPTPEPTTLLLFASGLAAIGAAVRRRKAKTGAG